MMVGANALPVRRLLERRGEVLLYEVLIANRSVFVVENSRDSWRFSLLYSAESKFLREVNKASTGRERHR